ncbi:endonuclease/exonuclease/phosphatase family protein [Amycolatopsis sp. K13G38]|uniref:Endonuclease/exonuclease/phosphatase family protein n=1 Tax=Amycolatopsis acididurans TaxID=2724524 RepID=A0ABX1JBE5_9PSEU|nr:endonuclease/exonuclease/phosphatase family protein [Amycolatopsis acididurans]NKQ57078.1 endonuclease/exonuclease/phosphatase family protein [Amycolatopsis acididurans]
MIFFAVLTAGFLVLAALRLCGVDGDRITAALIALTPYWTLGGLLIGGVALGFRHWWIGGVAVAVAIALVAMVLPRAFASSRPDAHGATLRVMSSNQYLGRADVNALVKLVRDNQVDVLNLLELTPREVRELTSAGLFDLLPHRVLKPIPGANGSGIASRYPLTELSLVGPGEMEQPSARVEIGGTPVEIVAVHPVAPTASSATWKSDLARLPRPDSGGAVRILAGDFNATLDHAAFRDLLHAGYVDAGDNRGAGFAPTWPSGAFPPPVTIDHVLVDPRIAVAGYRVLDVPGSDHNAVFAQVTLP